MSIGGESALDDTERLWPHVSDKGDPVVIMVHPLGVILVGAETQAHEARLVRSGAPLLVLARRLVQERLVQLGLVGASVIEIRAGVQAVVVPLEFPVQVVAAAGGVETALMEPVAGFLVLVDIDGDDRVVTSGLLSRPGRLGATYLLRRAGGTGKEGRPSLGSVLIIGARTRAPCAPAQAGEKKKE